MDQTRTWVETAEIGKGIKVIKLRLSVMQQEQKRKKGGEREYLWLEIWYVNYTNKRYVYIYIYIYIWILWIYRMIHDLWA